MNTLIIGELMKKRLRSFEPRNKNVKIGNKSSIQNQLISYGKKIKYNLLFQFWIFFSCFHSRNSSICGLGCNNNNCYFA